MSTLGHFIGDGSSNISVDANPNTTAPASERQWDAPSASLPDGATPWIAVRGGISVTLQLWVYDSTMSRWFKLQPAFGLSSDQVQTLSPAPRGAKLFLQVTALLGNVNWVGLGFLGDG